MAAMTDSEIESTLGSTGGLIVRLAQRFKSLLFGFDFFISYRHADSAHFARSLARELELKHFDCFLDLKHYEAGGNLPRLQTRALGRSRKLIVVVSERAHESPANGTDWLIAEILEFKWLKRKDGEGTIVPIGTPNTLNFALHPNSRVLQELTNNSKDVIYIHDNAIDENGDVSAGTVDKLTNDYHQLRVRTTRIMVLCVTIVAICSVGGWGVFSYKQARIEHEESKLKTVFQYIERGKEALAAKDLDNAEERFSTAISDFRALNRNPILAEHLRFATRIQRLHAKEIAQLSGEVDLIRVSRDGDFILVVYDYQAPSGSPESSEIPDWDAFGIFQRSTGKWTIKQRIDSPVGNSIYQISPSKLIDFEAPHYAILTTDTHGELQRMSLIDGKSSAFDAVHPQTTATKTLSSEQQKWFNEIYSKLYRIEPSDGIDEYSPRLVDEVFEQSPDGRTGVLGSYEGRAMLLDFETRTVRGEIEVGSVFAAAYTHDGTHAFVGSRSALWEIDAAGVNGLTEGTAPLLTEEKAAYKRVKALSTNDRLDEIAIATHRRILYRNISSENWASWSLPAEIDKVVAFNLDAAKRQIVLVGQDCTAFVVNLDGADSSVHIMSGPTTNECVAWAAADSNYVWRVPREMPRGIAQVIGSPLSGGGFDRKIEFRADEFNLSDDPPQVHAIAELGGTVHLFVGGSSSSDFQDVRPETLVRISLNDSTKRSTEKIFEPTVIVDNLGEPHWDCEETVRVAPGSTLKYLVGITEYPDTTYRLGSAGPELQRANGFAARTLIDGGETYFLDLAADESSIFLHAKNRGNGTTVEYRIPWHGEVVASLGAISDDGRRLLFLNRIGEFVIVNIEN